MNRTYNLARFINYVTAGYVFLFVFIPPLQVGTIYRLLAIAASLVWFFTGNGLGVAPISKRGFKFIQVSVICAALMIFVSSFIYGFPTAIVRNLQFIIMCIVAYMSLYYFENDTKFLDLWMTVALIVICFFCITTMRGLQENPYASRIANSEWLEDRFEGNENVGLYGYVYMCIMLFPMLLYKILGRVKVNKLFDLFCVIDLVLIALLALNAGYMIGICCLLAGTLIVLLLRKVSYGKIALTIALVVLFVFLYRIIVTAFFDIAMDLLGNNVIYYQKISDFRLLFLEGSTTGDSVDGRFSNYAASIKGIWMYPILGSYMFGVTLGGGHSTFFDTIGKMGWLVAILYFYIMWVFPYKIYMPKEKKYNVLKISTIVLLIIFAVFDPYSQEIAISSMVFFPYFMFIADRHDEYSKQAPPEVRQSKIRAKRPRRNGKTRA